MAKRRKTAVMLGVHDKTTAPKQVIWLAVLAVLFFLTICFSAPATIKTTVLVLLCVTLLAGVLCFRTLLSRMHLPLFLLLLVVLMGGISSAYAISGKFALYELLKLVSALCAALLLMLLTPGEGANPGRRVATVLEGAAGLASLFSIDLISTRLLSTPLLAFLGRHSTDFIDLNGVEAGVRMTSIFTFPNIFAGCAGIGVLLALGLALSSAGKKERRFHLCCLYVNALAFVLAFSMGATVCIFAAFLIYLLLEHKERRGQLFILMLETLVLVAVGVVLSSATALDAWDGIQPVPLLCLIFGSALLCLADQFLGQKAAKALLGRGKVLLVVVIVIIALLAGFALTAYHLTGGTSLEQDEALRRSIYPAPGTYTLSAQSSADLLVTVESQNRQDTMMHTSTVLYSGTLSEASFTVPEDSVVVYLNFRATEPVQLDQVEYVGTATGLVPLNYKLLPDFIANRLQGLFANQNAVQRTVFFEDGIKLFKESPIVGNGLGSFETAIHSVQSFFYETKYVHNHYIQTLLETGIIGLILLVGLLVVSAFSILKSRKQEQFHPLTPALGALLIFMAAHGAVEVVFSSYPYLPLAFGVFLLINLCCGDSLSPAWCGKKVKIVSAAVTAVLMVIFLVLLGNNVTARKVTEEQRSFSAIERAAKMDKFEWVDYRISYVMSSLNDGISEEVKLQAGEYAEQMKKVQSNTVSFYLTRYYFETGNVESALEMAEKHVHYLAASSSAWNDILALAAAYEPVYGSDAAYQEGISSIAAFLETWEAEHMGSIQLSESNQAFLSRVSAN